MRQPYPLSREEQAVFFQEMPDHLARMALFNSNTGTREDEVSGLRWKWEVQVCIRSTAKRVSGRRLRAAGVPFEDRQDLLGHKDGRITPHHSAAELANLIAAAERVCEETPANLPQAPGYGVERVSGMRSNLLIAAHENGAG